MLEGMARACSALKAYSELAAVLRGLLAIKRRNGEHATMAQLRDYVTTLLRLGEGGGSAHERANTAIAARCGPKPTDAAQQSAGNVFTRRRRMGLPVEEQPWYSAWADCRWFLARSEALGLAARGEWSAAATRFKRGRISAAKSGISIRGLDPTEMVSFGQPYDAWAEELSSWQLAKAESEGNADTARPIAGCSSSNNTNNAVDWALGGQISADTAARTDRLIDRLPNLEYDDAGIAVASFQLKYFGGNRPCIFRDPNLVKWPAFKTWETAGSFAVRNE